MGDSMIKFPPPLDWFQKKLWRIRWIEWMIVLVLMMVFDSGDANLKDYLYFIFMIPIAALVYTFAIKYLLLIMIVYPLKIMASLTGFGLMYSFLDLMEAIGRIINDANNHIIGKFCEEKPEFDPELSGERLFGK
jgi:hypothetical protein